MQKPAEFIRDQGDATAIEYSLVAAGISIAIIVVVNTLGCKLANTFTTISNSVGE
jgi:pilus assembly protein Flp/PilA